MGKELWRSLFLNLRFSIYKKKYYLIGSTVNLVSKAFKGGLSLKIKKYF